jgi:DNA-binding transcriptional MerR regulator
MAIKSLISIREFAEFADIKQTTLRYYDDLGIFSPITRTESGFRYYSPTQIIRLNVIRTMQELNVPMKDIAEFEQNRTPELMLQSCVGHLKRLDAEMRKINHLRDIIGSFHAMLFEGRYAQEGIAIGDFEAIPGVLGPTIEYNGDDGFSEMFLDFCLNSKSQGMEMLYPICGYYKTAADFFKAPEKPTNFFSMNPSGRDEIPAGTYIYSHRRGDYVDFHDLPERLLEYSKAIDEPKNKMDMNKGPVYHMFLQDETSTRNPEDYLSRLSIFVAPAEE